jgi:hypothetical protein
MRFIQPAFQEPLRHGFWIQVRVDLPVGRFHAELGWMRKFGNEYDYDHNYSTTDPYLPIVCGVAACKCGNHHEHPRRY